ncbi:TetR/AcrR family transcriptional regulator [Pseudonocardia endophytica]|uniref:TetR family transcriptional regulator n=1 Tax=Pseudonocardia endophytica TaxID=401976 RepID=A0A4R1HP92_PSEEN|nr:TetR family transcriptional regulator [Pseudonocardia endophytica]TCK21549.1 TetR family transcriptional regulator [Pseudonocardia endophytica]
MTKPEARSTRRPADKFEDRRRELADAALMTLADLGYARTSLREIAQNSAFSHGVLHYYFHNKVELITYCVRQYKATCVLRYDGIAAEASDPAALAEAFGEGLAATLSEDALMHRLWYDLRSQSLFEESFREDVAEIDDSLQRMVWRVVVAYSELTGTAPTCTPSFAYAAFDGLFQQALLRHLSGSGAALDDLRAGARELLPRLFAPAAP